MHAAAEVILVVTVNFWPRAKGIEYTWTGLSAESIVSFTFWPNQTGIAESISTPLGPSCACNADATIAKAQDPLLHVSFSLQSEHFCRWCS